MLLEIAGYVVAFGGGGAAYVALSHKGIARGLKTFWTQFTIPLRRPEVDHLAELHKWHLERRIEKSREKVEWQREYDRLDPPPFTKKDRIRATMPFWILDETTIPITLTSTSGMSRYEWTRTGWTPVIERTSKLNINEESWRRYIKQIAP